MLFRNRHESTKFIFYIFLKVDRDVALVPPVFCLILVEPWLHHKLFLNTLVFNILMIHTFANDDDPNILIFTCKCL